MPNRSRRARRFRHDLRGSLARKTLAWFAAIGVFVLGLSDAVVIAFLITRDAWANVAALGFLAVLTALVGLCAWGTWRLVQPSTTVERAVHFGARDPELDGQLGRAQKLRESGRNPQLAEAIEEQVRGRARIVYNAELVRVGELLGYPRTRTVDHVLFNPDWHRALVTVTTDYVDRHGNTVRSDTRTTEEWVVRPQPVAAASVTHDSPQYVAAQQLLGQLHLYARNYGLDSEMTGA